MAIRITGGNLGGRYIEAPSGRQTRPTSSLVRQAVFNITRDLIEGAYCLDLYSGTAVMLIEAMSRGADQGICVEKDRKTAQLIQKNVQKMELQSRVTILTQDALKYRPAADLRFDFIYADPPFVQAYPDLQHVLGWLKEGGIAFFEFPARCPQEWMSKAAEIREYGESWLAVFRELRGLNCSL